MKEYKNSKHPNWGENGELYFIPKNATKLIIGTLPPSRLCDNELELNDINFFYGSKDNYFWKIMKFINNSKINDLDEVDRFNTVDECKKFLNDNKIGLIDIIKECKHKLGVNGKPLASDDTISDITPIDLMKVLKEYKDIDTIFYTGEEVVKLLNKYYSTEICSKLNAITFKDNDKLYKFYKLYSPTRRVYNRFKKDRNTYLENYLKLIDK